MIYLLFACMEHALTTPPAYLDVTGDKYSEEEKSIFYKWFNKFPLQYGQIINITFLENAATSDEGNIIDQQFPEEELNKETIHQQRLKKCKEIREQPKLRDQLSFKYESSYGSAFLGETKPEEHGFRLVVFWASLRTESARVSLSSYTIESIEESSPSNNLISENIHYGGEINFSLIAST